MTRDPVVVHGEDDAAPLLALFERQGFNAVAVGDPAGYLLGMVTKLSLLRLFRRGVPPRPPKGGPAESTGTGRNGRTQSLGGTRRRSQRDGAADDAVACPERSRGRAIRKPPPARWGWSAAAISCGASPGRPRRPRGLRSARLRGPGRGSTPGAADPPSISTGPRSQRSTEAVETRVMLTRPGSSRGRECQRVTTR
jgi:hypothetical protein